MKNTMARLGSEKHPAVVRVRTEAKAAEIMRICSEHGWMVIAGIEPDKPEDVSDVERLLSKQDSPAPPRDIKRKTGRNDPCPCGSGLKYKKCCMRG